MATFPLPQPGSRVKIVTRYPETYLYAREKFYENVTEGAVQAPSRGDPEDTIRVVTNNPLYPVSLVTLGAHVVSLEVDGKLIRPGTKKLPARSNVFKKRIANSKGDGSYLVTCIDGLWRCECPANGFNKKCRHITLAQESFNAKSN